MSENPIEAGEKKIESAIKSEPWYVWAGAAVAAGTIVYFVWRRKKSAASTSTTNTPNGQTNDGGQLNGYQVDSMAGLPFGYEAGGYNYQGGPVDNYPGGYSETSVNGNNVPILPTGENPIFDPNGNLIGFQAPGQQPTVSPIPQPAPAPESGIIRKRQTSGVTASYDKGSPNGVPFRTTPGGTVISSIPYGSSVTITGIPVQGTDNFGSKQDPTHAGSMLWFPVTVGNTKGYVSAYDITNVATSGKGGGGIPEEAGGFHLAVNAGRNTVDQWTFANGMHHSFDAYAPVGE